MTELEAWETAVRERPSEARIFGPPSWLVLETWQGAAKESFQDAAVRVRERYGLDEPQGPRMSDRVRTKTKEGADIPQSADNVRTCKGCSEPWTGRGLVCWACQKQRQRGNSNP